MGEQILAHKYLLADYYARIRAYEGMVQNTTREILNPSTCLPSSSLPSGL